MRKEFRWEYTQINDTIRRFGLLEKRRYDFLKEHEKTT